MGFCLVPPCGLTERMMVVMETYTHRQAFAQFPPTGTGMERMAELVRGRNKRGLVQLFIHLSWIFLERVSQHLFGRNASYKNTHTHTSNFKVKVPFLET